MGVALDLSGPRLALRRRGLGHLEESDSVVQIDVTCVLPSPKAVGGLRV